MKVSEQSIWSWGRCPQTPGILRFCAGIPGTARASHARPGGIPAPESALGLRPRSALSSAQVRSVYQGRFVYCWPFTQIT